MKPLAQMTTQDLMEIVKKVDRKTWIKVGVGSVCVLLALIFIIWPAWVERPGLKRKISETQGQISQVETLNIRKPMLIRTKTDYLEFIKNAKERLFQPGETSLLLGAISKIADETKVSIIASSPKDFVDKFPAPFDAQYEASLYDFTVEGGYHELGQFVSRIEANPKLLRIQEFHLRPSQNDSKSHLTNMSISAVSFKSGSTPLPTGTQK